jgi:restriction system protein
MSKGWLDSLVSITAIQPDPENTLVPSPNVDPDEDDSVSLSVTISTLRSATSGVTSVKEGDTLVKAVTLMVRYNYSQLAVLNQQGDITGVVSWETIGRARLGRPDPTLSQATEIPQTVPVNANLLSVVAEVATRDYVFVRGMGSHSPLGIVTVADLTDQFYVMARPFTVIEEVERRLRRCTDERVPLTVMKAAAGNRANQVHSAANLTMGGYKHLYKEEASFAHLGWDIDHQQFVELLSSVHALRNNLMHFSTDPLADQDIARAEALLQMLRVVDPRP